MSKFSFSQEFGNREEKSSIAVVGKGMGINSILLYFRSDHSGSSCARGPCPPLLYSQASAPRIINP